MPATPFEAAVRRRDGSVIIDLWGDIDGDAEPGLDEAYGAAAAAGAEHVVLNFTSVGYINSTGIALIVGLLARGRADQRQLAAFGLDEHYREIFAITRLSDYLAIFPDERSALGEQPTTI